MRRPVFFILCIFIFHLPVFAGEKLTVESATREVVLSGYTRNVNFLTVSSEISGKVLKVYYDIGQTIGERVFLALDPAFVELEIEQNQGELERVDILIQKASSRTAYLEKEFKRVDNLYENQLITEAKRDALFQDLEQAGLELASRKKEKSILLTKQRELLERKNRHFITAPEGWVVIERTVEAGEIVHPGTPLAKVGDYRTLVVPLSVTGEELEAVRSSSGKGPATLEGKPVGISVNWVNPEFNEKTRKLGIELAIDGYSGIKRGGLKLVLSLRITSEGVRVPKAAVTMRYENPTVTVRHSNERVHILIISESENSFLVASDSRLAPGTELLPPAGEHETSRTP